MLLGNFFYSALNRRKHAAHESRIACHNEVPYTRPNMDPQDIWAPIDVSMCRLQGTSNKFGSARTCFVFHKHGVDTREWRGAMGGSRSRPGRGLCVTLGRALRPHRHEPCPVRRHTRGRRRSRRGRCTPSLSVSGNSAGFKWVANGSLQSPRF